MRVLLWLFGFCEVELSVADMGAFIDACRMCGRHPRWMRRRGRNVRYYFFAHGVSLIREAAGARGVAVRICRRGGLPYLMAHVLKSPGLLAGIALAAALTVASQLVLFDIEIEGNEYLDEAELRTELAAAGLRLGCFLPGIDTDAVETALRLGNDRIAYVAVNLSGTVAKVQIREAVTEAEKQPLSPANLVAK